MRLLFALAGLHKYDRGAEIAFISLADALGRLGQDVTLMGSGPHRPDASYRYVSVPAVDRKRFERFPAIPPFRVNTVWEELTFVPGMAIAYRPSAYDLTMTCSYPFTNWLLRRSRLGGRRPPSVFVTQNGDWPARVDDAEYRFFGCEGLVCTNPDYFELNKSRWPATLIPNGIDLARFHPDRGDRARFGLPEDRPVVLMVSALIASKRVLEGIEAVARTEDMHLAIAGDGPMRCEVRATAERLLGNRFSQFTVPAAEMPALYRSADIFLHLSRDESFGNVFVEALACGLPVVADQTPRVSWIVGEHGFLVDTSSPQAIAMGLCEALAEGEAGKIGRAARAEQFSWDIVSRKYLDFFTEVVAAGPRP